MFDVKPLIVVAVLVTPNVRPLFVGGFHVITYKLVVNCGIFSVTDEDVDDIIIGEIALAKTVSNLCQWYIINLNG